MAKLYEIRADHDAKSIVVYQAYRKQIAVPAIEKQTFVPPFSLNRMTWIKPSFLWLMERSNWAQKSGQEYILAIRISQKGWLKALSEGIITSPEKRVYPTSQAWGQKFDQAKVHIQWDTERNIRGNALNHYSIQVGISSAPIEEFVKEWIIEIKDYTPLVKKIHNLCKTGDYDKAKKHLPAERIYPLSDEIRHIIGAS